MIYGVTFGEKHTFRDWGLLPAERAKVSPAEPKYNISEIPGSDEVIDYTDTLDGHVHYKQREYSQKFNIIKPRSSWFSIYSDIMDYLQGKKLKMILDEDPTYYYEGRFQVDEWNSEEKYSTITIIGSIYPYKMETSSSTEDWIWDTLDFENGIIREYGNLTLDGSLEVTVIGSRRISVPIITVSSDMEVDFQGKTYQLTTGDNEIPDIEIGDGEYELTFRGNGTVTISYRGGRL